MPVVTLPILGFNIRERVNIVGGRSLRERVTSHKITNNMSTVQVGALRVEGRIGVFTIGGHWGLRRGMGGEASGMAEWGVGSEGEVRCGRRCCSGGVASLR